MSAGNSNLIANGRDNSQSRWVSYCPVSPQVRNSAHTKSTADRWMARGPVSEKVKVLLVQPQFGPSWAKYVGVRSTINRKRIPSDNFSKVKLLPLLARTDTQCRPLSVEDEKALGQKVVNGREEVIRLIEWAATRKKPKPVYLHALEIIAKGRQTNQEVERIRKEGSVTEKKSHRDYFWDSPGYHAAAQELKRDTKNLEQNTLINEAKAAVKEFMDRNVRLVFKMAVEEYGPQHPRINDLIQEGIFGLEDAAIRFDPESGIRFAFYARAWIRSYFSAFLAREKHIIDVPIRLEVEALALDQKVAVLENTLGRQATDEEICKELKITDERLQMLKSLAVDTFSADDPIEEGRRATYSTRVVDENTEGADEALARDVLIQSIREVLKSDLLDKRQKRIIRVRFALGRIKESMSLEDLGKEFSLSGERIRQIETKAKKIIKDYILGKHPDIQVYIEEWLGRDG